MSQRKVNLVVVKRRFYHDWHERCRCLGHGLNSANSSLTRQAWISFSATRSLPRAKTEDHFVANPSPDGKSLPQSCHRRVGTGRHLLQSTVGRWVAGRIFPQSACPGRPAARSFLQSTRSGCQTERTFFNRHAAGRHPEDSFLNQHPKDPNRKRLSPISEGQFTYQKKRSSIAPPDSPNR
jgi:hypothetical protein